MKQIPIVVSGALGSQPKSIASSSRAVGLLLPGMLVLEPSTDPSRLELRKNPFLSTLTVKTQRPVRKLMSPDNLRLSAKRKAPLSR